LRGKRGEEEIVFHQCGDGSTLLHDCAGSKEAWEAVWNISQLWSKMTTTMLVKNWEGRKAQRRRKRRTGVGAESGLRCSPREGAVACRMGEGAREREWRLGWECQGRCDVEGSALL
jgi:hypothetical protein